MNIDFQTILTNLFTFLLTFLADLAISIVILIVGFQLKKLVIKLLKKTLEKHEVEAAPAGFICSVLNVILIVVIIILSIGNIGIEFTALFAALGAAGLTASFALQGSLSNFVSGMLLIFSKPFKVDDFLSVDTFSGSVKKITVLNTTLITPDNKEVIIPNSLLTSDIVVNFTSQKSRRLDLSYSVSYDIDTEIPKKIITDLVKNCDKVIMDPEPIIAVGLHKDSSVEIVAKIWVESDFYWDVYHYMQEAVKKEFDKNNVTIPFPQLVVYNEKD